MKSKNVWGGILVCLFIACMINVWGAGNYPQPTICDRACWSARTPSCQNTFEPAVNRAVIHHTEVGGQYECTSIEDSKASARSMQNYHMDSVGWCDIAYNFFSNKFGDTLEGMKDSITAYPSSMRPSYRVNTVHFAGMGDFGTKKNNQPNVILRERLYDLIAWKMPDGYSPFGSGNYEATPNVGWLCSHRDIVSTTCPGDLLYTYIGTDFDNAESRHEVNDRINGITHPTDIVRIIKAQFVTKGGTLTVEVLSNKQPDAVMTLQGIGAVPFVLLSQQYIYTKSRTTNPGTVTVTSSLGGSATATVIVP